MKENHFENAFKIVQEGYDQLAEAYITEREKFDNWQEIKAFIKHLKEGARVLDAGSGTGIPISRFLVQEGFEVTGIDLSRAMVEVARKNVPEALFHQMNITEIDFPSNSFDGLVSCYAIIHIPREKHAGLFKSLHRILKAQGIMLISVACWEWEEVADYLGVDMFWSHYDSARTESLIRDAGFKIEFGRSLESGGEKHHWVLATKQLDKN
jgi:ubiquinone/menaquinone biosynthesis C-methylase UbiE